MIKIILVLFVLRIILSFLLYSNNEDFTPYKTSCENNNLPKLLQQAINEHDIKLDDKKWKYFIPCSYNSCEGNIRKLIGSKNKNIFMIDGCDTIAGKNSIFKTLKEKYGDQAINIMPNTFDIRNKDEIKEFYIHFNNKRKQNIHTKYILKNRQQRQLGLKLINKLSELETEIEKDNFYLVQDYLNNPYLINKRKINLRYYLLIICRKGKVEGYIYKDGFVYYTPEYFNKNSIEANENITTGYIDRQIYVDNPLTTQDFLESLGKEKAAYFDKIVNKKFYYMVHALKDKICKINQYPDSTLFQLFGADIAPTDKLDAHFMEINKGPDIGGKDTRDINLKLDMLKGIFKLVDIDDIKNVCDLSNKLNYKKIY